MSDNNKLNYPENWLFLTTLDNPFNPATQNQFWLEYDRDHGYNTPSLQARYFWSSEELSEIERIEANNNSVLDVVNNDLTGKYIAVKETSVIKPISIKALQLQ